MLVRRKPVSFPSGALALLGVAATTCIATAAGGKASALAMLDRIEPGLWQIIARDETEVVSICVNDGRQLIQIRHRGESCRPFVIDDQPAMVTVQYTCPSQGYGHTQIRFENMRLVQLETQGIESGLPFNFKAEGRRLGRCHP
jgi:hypothetical protein